MHRRGARVLFVVGVVASTACSLASLDGLTSDGTSGGGGPDATAQGKDGEPASEAGGNGDGGGACAANLASDPANCGSCGHDCLNGACQAGRCQPVVLASSLPEVFSVALDATDVYWTGAGSSIGRVPKSGGTVIPFATGLTSPSAIAIDDANLYVGVTAPDGGGIEARRLSGGAFGLLVPGAMVSRIVVRGGALFWTDDGAPPGLGSVMSVPTTPPATVTTISNNRQGPRGIAVNSTTVFWTESNGGMVLSCPLAGCTGQPQALATGQNYPIAIAADESNVYYAEETAPNRIRSCPAAGCLGEPTTLATSPTITAMVLTSTALYWVTSDAVTGTVSTCPLSGTNGAPPTVLVANQNRPFTLAVDDKAIYWGTRGTESVDDAMIMKLAR